MLLNNRQLLTNQQRSGIKIHLASMVLSSYYIADRFKVMMLGCYFWHGLSCPHLSRQDSERAVKISARMVYFISTLFVPDHKYNIPRAIFGTLLLKRGQKAYTVMLILSQKPLPW